MKKERAMTLILGFVIGIATCAVLGFNEAKLLVPGGGSSSAYFYDGSNLYIVRGFSKTLVKDREPAK